MGIQKCIVQNCGQLTTNFSLPRVQKVRNIWLARVGYKGNIPSNLKVCSKHFSPVCIRQTGRGLMLIKGSLPSLYLPDYVPVGQLSDNFYFCALKPPPSTSSKPPEKIKERLTKPKALFEGSMSIPELVSPIKLIIPQKVYSRRRRLFADSGNETIVDVFLHDNNIPIKPEPNILPSSNETIFRDSKILNLSHLKSHTFENRTLIKDEPMDDTFEDRTLIKDEPMDDTFEENVNILRNIKSELPSTDTCSEHNYCHDDETAVEEEMDEENSNLNTSILDHNYSLPYSDSDSSPKNVTNREEKVDEQRQEHDNNLIFGLDASYGDVRLSSEEDDATGKPVVRTFTTATGQPIKVLPQSFNKVLLKNGNIVQIRLLKVPQTKQIECDTVTKELLNVEKDKIYMEKYKVNFPKKMFKNVGEVLPYLFKRLPMWDESAKNPDFKRTYPYVANSLEEFMSWNEGKRLNSEWSRAKCVKKILCREHFPDVENWNTKSLFMYARSHGYSLPILHSSILFTTPSTELDLLSNCYSNSSQNDPCNNDINSDLNVNITDDNDASSPLKNRQSINISDSSLKHQRTFIKETALDRGILLKEEDIADGVSWNGAERMILEAVKCLAENLIRRARHHAVCKGDNSEIVEIDADEIKIAIEERPEIKSIVEHQRRRLVEDFFS